MRRGSRFERTAGRLTEITVGPSPDGTGSRVVQVVAIENEAQRRTRDWGEENLAKVTASKERPAPSAILWAPIA